MGHQDDGVGRQDDRVGRQNGRVGRQDDRVGRQNGRVGRQDDGVGRQDDGVEVPYGIEELAMYLRTVDCKLDQPNLNVASNKYRESN